MHLKKRESNSSEEHMERSNSKDPVYCEIPERKANAGSNFDVDSADSDSRYQKINIANRSSGTLHGKINSLVPYEVNLDQSEV